MCERLAAAEHAQPEPPHGRTHHRRFRHHERHGGREALAEHADLSHDRVFCERALHFGGRNLRAGRESERVHRPACDHEVPRVVEPAEIARGEPAVGRRRSHVGAPWLDHTERRAGRAHEQVAADVAADVEAGQRRADGARPHGPRAGQGDDRPRFGEPVALHERHAAGSEDRGRAVFERRAARHAHPHRAAERGGQVGDPAGRHARRDPLEEHRHPEDHRGRSRAAGVKHLPPIADDDERAAADERRVEVADSCIRMREREPREPHVARVVEKHAARGGGVPGERPLRMHDAARMARRARREKDRRRRIGIARCRTIGEPREDRLAVDGP